MKLEEFFPLITNKVKCDIATAFETRFSHIIDPVILNGNPITVETLVIPNREFCIDKNVNEQERYTHKFTKKLRVVWVYKMLNSFQMDNEHLYFDFWAVGYINMIDESYSVETLDPIKYKLRGMQELRIDKVKNLKISSLFSYKSEYIPSDFISTFTNVTRKAQRLKDFEDFHFAHDLMYSTQAMSQTLAEMTLYRPYLYDFIKDAVPWHDKVLFRYFPSFYDQKYILLGSQFIQLWYNHWSKIGNLLSIYFETNLKDTQVYFDKVIENFPEHLKNENYNWLNNFKTDQYLKHNPSRRKIVHYKSFDIEVLKNWIDNNTDHSKVKELQDWIFGLIDEYKNLYLVTIEGVEQCLKLIDSKTQLD